MKFPLSRSGGEAPFSYAFKWKTRFIRIVGFPFMVKVCGEGKIIWALLLAVYLFPIPAIGQYNIDRVLVAGRSALYYEDYVLSMQYFNQVINAKPYMYEPWYYRAVAKYNLDDFVGSESDCTQAILLNPYISSMYDLRGICRIRQEKFKDAAADYDKAIQYDPTNASFWHNRALCRIQDKDYELANQEIDSMLTRWSRNAKFYQLKCEVCLRQQDTLKASEYLDRALEIDPYDGEAWTFRAMMSLSKKKWRDADRQLSQAIHLKPTVVNNYINRALSRYNLNNLRGAMADYDKAIELDPNNFMAHYNRGQLRVQVGDDNRAISDFDFIISREPSNVMAIFNRALLLDRTGDLRGAIRDYSTVIERFPNFWTGLQYRARCYRRLGMIRQAELDEFRVFKAQQDKHFGIQPRWSQKQKRAVRKLSDIDMDKYEQLVEADEQTVNHEYSSVYRGRVQNRKTEDEPMPMFVLSYRTYSNGVKSYVAFDASVDAFNRQSHPFYPVTITCNPKTLTEQETHQYFHLIDTLSARIQECKDLRNESGLLLQRAVAHSVAQDFESAISDLTAYLQIDSLQSIAFWQRAVCRAMLLEFTSTQGIETELKSAATVSDFNTAHQLSPGNPYICYDRGCFYMQKQDYAKAVDDFSAALSMDSRIAEAYYNRGLCRIRSGHRSSGIEDLSKAGELGLYDAYSIIKKYRTK